MLCQIKANYGCGVDVRSDINVVKRGIAISGDGDGV